MSSERGIHSRASDLGGGANARGGVLSSSVPPRSDHIVSPRVYVGVFLALMVGTGITVFAATVDLGMWNTPVALLIAVAKAMLVVLFFMHVKYSSRLVALAVGGSILWFLLLIAGVVADYLSRGWVGTPGT
jgi:cytochrome c oxidase subunit IV